MRTFKPWILGAGMIFICGYLLRPGEALAQRPQVPGHSIGKVTTQGNLVVLELDEGAVAPANLFDLPKRTLRFTPSGSGYRVENAALPWDAEFGSQLKDPIVTLRNFRFPFSGKNWDAFSVGQTGTIRFGEPPAGTGPVTAGRGGACVGQPQVGHFEELWVAAGRRYVLQRDPGPRRQLRFLRLVLRLPRG